MPQARMKKAGFKHDRFLYHIWSALIIISLLIMPVNIADVFAQADNLDISQKVRDLSDKNFSNKIKAVEALAQMGHKQSALILEALKDGALYVRKRDGQVFIIRKEGQTVVLIDPVSGQDAGTESEAALEKIKLNNSLREVIAAALGGLTLQSNDPVKRRAAADAIFKSRDAKAFEGLQKAIQEEKNTDIRQALLEARAVIILFGKSSDENKVAAIEIIKNRGDQDALAALKASLVANPASVTKVAEKAIAGIENRQAYFANVQNVIYGLSLGSVLLLAAIGLAITFGVMGVINMAHGEMVMIGAYTSFVIQDIMTDLTPSLMGYSLIVAVPAAFLVAGVIGMAIERGVIRYLYGRPLETLLATWGVSLVLQQAVRSLFGPTNQKVSTPFWMEGAFEMGGLTLTYNRIAIIIFSLAVFFALLFILKKTFFGLQMRAVTQNRAMAASMGISAKWVDALTFGLGSGIAGIAGVALSQIDNVSPNLGQSYIIDSFMVVVFGGVGNIWGTLVGAFSLGIANKFLEPYAGAVLGKIFVLVFIILFIQKRPRGLFALKGRAVEA